MVRMGEMHVSSEPGHVLAAIGLGSCIGLVLLEPARARAGMAHIVLPSAPENHDGLHGKFADRAVPALLREMDAIGSSRRRLRAVLIGGAQMFSVGTSSNLDIGRRNEEATREALASLGMEVHAADTGGSQGRTVRVYVGSGRVTVKGPGAGEIEVVPGIETVGALA